MCMDAGSCVGAMDSFFCITCLEKADPSSASGHHLLIVLRLWVRLSDLLPASCWNFAGLILFRACACSPSCYAFMCETACCVQETLFGSSHPRLLPLTIFLPPLSVPEPWGGVWDMIKVSNLGMSIV